MKIKYLNLNDKKNIYNYKLKKKFCAIIPPPNITGGLHLGHAFQSTIIDIIICYFNINKYSILCKFGLDHAGIATQILIKNKLIKYHCSFILLIKYINIWKILSSKKISKQFKKICNNISWKTKRFTLDKNFINTVNISFYNFYNLKIIYSSKRLVNWNIFFLTSISDLELVIIIKFNTIYFIKYNLHSKLYISIANINPIDIFNCSNINIPIGDKYNFLCHNTLKKPLICDYIQIKKKRYNCFYLNFSEIVPSSNFYDFNVNEKLICIFNKRFISNYYKLPVKLCNLNKRIIKNKILIMLNKFDIIKKKKKIFQNKFSICNRSKSNIESMVTNQWYIYMKFFSKLSIYNIEKNKLSIFPIKWKKLFFIWLYNVKDWCISRQIKWGHKIFVKTDLKKYTYINYQYNNFSFFKINTLDTWFSSSLWSFSCFSWPRDTIEYNNYYPIDVLVTGFDIIFYWVIKMIMFSLFFTNYIPFKCIFIHGLIRDVFGDKMSKSKGNILDPIDLIQGISFENLLKKRLLGLLKENIKNRIIILTKKEYPNGIKSHNLELLRLCFINIISDSQNIYFSLKNLKLSKKFCDKLLNVVRYIKKNINYIFFKKNLNDKWIINLFIILKKKISFNINFINIKFIWNSIFLYLYNEYCSWYVFSIKGFNINYKLYNNTPYLILLSIIKYLRIFIPKIVKKIKFKINFHYFFKNNFINFNLLFYFKDILILFRKHLYNVICDKILLFVFFSKLNLNLLENLKYFFKRSFLIKQIYIKICNKIYKEYNYLLKSEFILLNISICFFYIKIKFLFYLNNNLL